MYTDIELDCILEALYQWEMNYCYTKHDRKICIELIKKFQSQLQGEELKQKYSGDYFGIPDF